MSAGIGQEIVFGAESAAARLRARRERTLIGGTLAFVALGLSQALVFQRAGAPWIATAMLVCMALGLANAGFVWRGGSVRAGTARALVVLWLAISYAILYSGGYRAANYFWLFLLPFAAGLLLGQRAGWLWVGFLSLQSLGFYALEITGTTPEPMVSTVGLRVLANRLGAVIAIGAMMNLYMRDQRNKDLELARAFQDLERQREEIRKLAYHDPLTGLANRRRFTELTTRAIEGARRRGERLALFFVDLDHFKPINDEFGHSVGDLVIAETGRRIQDAVRASDLVGRLSDDSIVSRIAGDEFTVLMSPMETGADAESVAARIVAALEAPIEYEDRRIEVAASIGIALLCSETDSYESLLKAADAAMYEAKREGRGWVVAERTIEA